MEMLIVYLVGVVGFGWSFFPNLEDYDLSPWIITLGVVLWPLVVFFITLALLWSFIKDILSFIINF